MTGLLKIYTSDLTQTKALKCPNTPYNVTKGGRGKKEHALMRDTGHLLFMLISLSLSLSILPFPPFLFSLIFFLQNQVDIFPCDKILNLPDE